MVTVPPAPAIEYQAVRAAPTVWPLAQSWPNGAVVFGSPGSTVNAVVSAGWGALSCSAVAPALESAARAAGATTSTHAATPATIARRCLMTRS